MSAPNEDRLKFESLFTEWEQETLFAANIPMMTWHPNFRAIVEMGETAAPFLYEKLVAGSSILGIGAMLWEIYQEGPNATHIAGNIEKLRELWLSWLEPRLFRGSE
jgi:hypothetical protein